MKYQAHHTLPYSFFEEPHVPGDPTEWIARQLMVGIIQNAPFETLLSVFGVEVLDPRKPYKLTGEQGEDARHVEAIGELKLKKEIRVHVLIP